MTTPDGRRYVIYRRAMAEVPGREFYVFVYQINNWQPHAIQWEAEVMARDDDLSFDWQDLLAFKAIVLHDLQETRNRTEMEKKK